MEILQARTLAWVAMEGPPEDLPNPGNEPRSPALQADSLPSEPTGNSKEGNGYQVFLPGTSHGQRSLEGYSPLSLKDSNMTE